jgi:hypothetical protein
MVYLSIRFVRKVFALIHPTFQFTFLHNLRIFFISCEHKLYQKFKNLICVFPGMKLRGLVPNSYIGSCEYINRLQIH